MWVFTRDGFFSIGVSKGNSTDGIEVRARHRNDLENLGRSCPSLSPVRVYEGPLGGSDYRYKARVSREELAKYVADSVMKIDYKEFKKAVDTENNDPMRTKAYVSCWHALFLWQESEFVEQA